MIEFGPRYFEIEHDLAHPIWPRVHEMIETSVPESSWHEAYTRFAEEWMLRLAESIGGDAHVFAGENLFLLTESKEIDGLKYVRFITSTLASIEEMLVEPEPDGGYGPRVVVLLSNDSTYRSYLMRSKIESDESAFGGAVTITDDYIHAVVCSDEERGMRGSLAYTLAQVRTVQTNWPLWLIEGVAMLTMEAAAGISYSLPMSPSQSLEQRTFWIEHGIEEFWSGHAFFRGDGWYPRASLLSKAITSDIRSMKKRRIKAFMECAVFEDAGQAAAAEHLGFSLGQLAAKYLGLGDWESSPKGGAYQPDNLPDY